MSDAPDPAAAPAWDGEGGLIVFDGVCVLCAGFARWVVRRDRAAYFKFATAQSPLGQALFREHGLDPDDFETNIVLDGGRAHLKLGSVAAVARRFAWPWKALAALGWIPRPLGDPIYDLVARNRHRLFGRRDACLVPTGDLKARLVEEPAPD